MNNKKYRKENFQRISIKLVVKSMSLEMGTSTGTNSSSSGGPGAAASTSTPQYGTGWQEFSERHGKAFAGEFAKSCVNYVNTNLPENVRTEISYEDFLNKFIEAFSISFESEYVKRQQQHNKVGFHLMGRCKNNGTEIICLGLKGRKRRIFFSKILFHIVSFKKSLFCCALSLWSGSGSYFRSMSSVLLRNVNIFVLGWFIGK